MTKGPVRYMRMTCPADVLAARAMINLRLAKGAFVQEIEPPWAMWLCLASRPRLSDEEALANPEDSELGPSLADIDTFKSLTSMWKHGQPAGPVRPLELPDVFRHWVLQEAPEAMLSDLIICETPSLEVLLSLIREHFLLQQGIMEYAEFMSDHEKRWLLRLRDPSRWALAQLPEGAPLRWYLEVPGQENLFVERGWSLRDPRNGVRQTQWKFLRHRLLLVAGDGAFAIVQPAWVPTETLVCIELPSAHLVTAKPNAVIEVTPRLQATQTDTLPVLWHIEDPRRLQHILSTEPLLRLSGFHAWFSSEEEIWVLAEDDRADRGLADILTDSFPTFCRLHRRVFVPRGMVLQPRLPEERLQQIYGLDPQDLLCLTTGSPTEVEPSKGASLRAIHLPAIHQRKLDFLLTFLAEKAIATVSHFSSRWTFDFPDLKKKRVLIEIEIPEAGPRNLHALKRSSATGGSLFGQLAAAARRLVGIEDPESLNDIDDHSPGMVGLIGATFPGQRRVAPRKGPLILESPLDMKSPQANTLRLNITNLDARLAESPHDAALWRERAALSEQLHAPISAVVSRLTAAVVTQDHPAFHREIFDFATRHPALAGMIDLDQATIEDRGRFLAGLRASDFEAEIMYSLQLVFAGMCDEPDIFRQAIESMRGGCIADRRQFHVFRESRLRGQQTEHVEAHSDGGSISLLSVKDLPRIRINVSKFLMNACCQDWGLIRLVRRQFQMLLAHHLGSEVARSLVSFEPHADRPLSFPNEAVRKTIAVENARETIDRQSSLIARRWADLDAWPDLPARSRQQATTQRWYDLLTMDKIGHVSISEMFTGHLYRPTFFFSRSAAGEAREIAAIPWLASLSKRDLPETSDGMPLARAIHQRFSAGHADWAEYFLNAARPQVTRAGRARAQRVLLLMVAMFGPRPEFEPHLGPLTLHIDTAEKWDMYTLTYFCDLYRLSLAYRRRIDEQRLFNLLLQQFPQPPHGWEHFSAAAEHFILCLFLNGSSVRRFQLDRMLDRTMRWAGYATKTSNAAMLDEALTILHFLEIGTLADLVPESIEQHQFQERRRTLWLDHARRLSDADGWRRWKTSFQAVSSTTLRASATDLQTGYTLPKG